jgi:predicted nucleotidyltransferase
MIKPRTRVPKKKVEAFCRKWNIKEFSLFGSVLRDDFKPDSDIDILVSFGEGSNYSLLNIVEMREELKAIFGRNIDLVIKKSIEESSNYIRRDSILSSSEILYAA